MLSQDISTWKAELKNDFEETGFARFPVLAGVKPQLYAAGASYASLSGSGAAFFSVFPR